MIGGSGGWLISPGVNAQERTKEELLESLIEGRPEESNRLKRDIEKIKCIL